MEPSWKEAEVFTIPGDDKYQTRKWTAMLKDCGHYYDIPNITDERTMKFKLMKKYDDLLEDNWRPPLQSRRDLLLWACVQHNSFLDNHKAPLENYDDCTNYY